VGELRPCLRPEFFRTSGIVNKSSISCINPWNRGQLAKPRLIAAVPANDPSGNSYGLSAAKIVAIEDRRMHSSVT